YACLKSVQHLKGVPKEMLQIEEGNCAILIQLEAKTQKILQNNMDFLKPKIQALKTLFGVHFSLDKQEQDSWWLIRKGILPIAAGNRPKGSVVIVEDICFFIEDFTKGIAEILKLFNKHSFKGIIFGHALSGNVHFIITPNLNDEKENKAFGELMEDLVKVVTNFQGSIKAEHGTGRMVAPFVELEWGKKAYAIHKKIKNLFDSKNLFNPDVIISEDKHIHLKNLKPSWEGYDEIGELVGSCMECGFCEKHCPSRNLTLTPRQRISIYAEIKRLESKDSLSIKEKEELESLKSGYRYFGIETCATCSACANLCPLHIDTARIAKNFKGDFPRIAHYMSENFVLTNNALKTAIKVANFTPFLSQTISKKLHSWIHTPVMPNYFPNANPQKVYSDSILPHKKEVVYFSSCLNRIFSPPKQAHDKRNIQEVFQSLCQKAEIKYRYPKNLVALCCSKAFKDYPNTARKMALKTFESLKEASKGGEIPIVCDHSACSLELLEKIREFEVLEGIRFQIFDMPSFVVQFIIPSLKISKKPIKIGLYAPCSTRSYQQEGDNEQALIDIARICAKEVFIHKETKCCGFAGNKGFLNPS
ncbi:MAG: 4Fe-4S dicluster domain-containing protein, partial [Helicobacter sp.]|nr:4Fe-4S dicluster domain-containing protein [Helicobacter sp.]